MNWLDHSRTFREQGVEESETLLLRRKFFYSDQNVDSRDPVQLNLLYVQVNTHTLSLSLSLVLLRNIKPQKITCCTPTLLHSYSLVYGLPCNYEGVQSEAEGAARGFNKGSEGSHVRMWLRRLGFLVQTVMHTMKVAAKHLAAGHHAASLCAVNRSASISAMLQEVHGFTWSTPNWIFSLAAMFSSLSPSQTVVVMAPSSAVDLTGDLFWCG